MNDRSFKVRVIGFLAALVAFQVSAHVPYIEKTDFSADTPFRVKNIPQSKAMYSWLEAPGDVDHYVMQVDEPTRIYVNTIVPHCQEYKDFAISYALIGPGLPAPVEALPVELRDGDGAVVVREQISQQGPRPILYENITNRVYFEGPTYDIWAESPGQYELIVWHENGRIGDYVAVIGKKEIFGPMDIVRALANTFKIRASKELRGPCSEVQDDVMITAEAR